MSWSIEEHIGEGRPWPAQVVVYRGETGECLAYGSGEVADKLQADNAELRDLAATLLKELLTAGVFLYQVGYTIAINDDATKAVIKRCSELGVEVDG